MPALEESQTTVENHILTFNEIDLSSVVTKFNIFIKVFLFFLTILPEQVTWILIEYNLLLWQKVMKLNSWLFTIVAKTLATFDLKRMKWFWNFYFSVYFGTVSFAWLWTLAIKKKYSKLKLRIIHASKYLIFFAFSKRSQLLKHVKKLFYGLDTIQSIGKGRRKRLKS